MNAPIGSPVFFCATFSRIAALAGVCLAFASTSSAQAPQITAQPQPRRATAGENVTFTVGATGVPPLEFQWRRNGLAIPQATSATLTLPAASQADSDLYDVAISNEEGAVTSLPAQLLVAPLRYPGRMAVDLDRSMALEGMEAGDIHALAVRADGKIYLAGTFTNVQGQPSSRLVRLNADGSHDATFTPAAIAERTIFALAALPSGGLLVAGSFASVGNVPTKALARLNANGTRDDSFNFTVDSVSAITRVLRATDGSVYLLGDFLVNPGTVAHVLKVDANGVADPAFNRPVFQEKGLGSRPSGMTLDTGGRLHVSGTFDTVNGVPRARLVRLLPDGTVDAAFSPGTGPGASQITALLPLSEGRLLVAGEFRQFNGANAGCITRLTASGSVDPSFDTGAGFSTAPFCLAALSDDRVFVGGRSGTTFNGAESGAGVVLTNLGTRDPDFTTSGATPWLAASLPNDRVLIYGTKDPIAIGSFGRRVVRALASTGTVVFDVALRFPARVNLLLPLAAGKVLVAGDFTHLNGVPASRVARLNADLTRDAGFIGSLNETVLTGTIQPDGKIVLLGTFTQSGNWPASGMIRLNADGSVDRSFMGSAPLGNWYSGPPVILPNGRFFVPTSAAAWPGTGLLGGFVVLEANGLPAIAQGFGSGAGIMRRLAAALTPTGLLLVVGDFYQWNGQNRSVAVRLFSNGPVDDSFSVNHLLGIEMPGSFYGVPFGRIQQFDGRIYVVPSYSPQAPVRLNPDGSRDSTFTATVPGPSLSGLHYFVQADDRLVLSAYASSDYFARFLSDGSADPTFGIHGSRFWRTAMITDRGELLSCDGTGFLHRYADAAAPVITQHPRPQAVPPGGSFTFSVAATGFPAVTYQWFKDGVAVPGATNSTLTLTNATAAHTGYFAVRVGNPLGSVTSSAAALEISGLRGILAGAARARSDSGDAALQGAFIVEGPAPKQMLVRVLGPALLGLGVSDAMADPRIEIFDAATGARVAENDDWHAAPNSGQAAAVAAELGAFALAGGSRDAVVLGTFPPGAYRVRTSAATGAHGSAMLEVYDADVRPRLVFLATRTRVTAGAEVLTQGVLLNTPAAGRTYLIRALGPSLGLPGALPDPLVSVFRGATRVAGNDDWSDAPAVAELATRAGAMPLPPLSRDAALPFVPAEPGTYTVQVTGAPGQSGLAWIEIHEVDNDRAPTLAPALVSQPGTGIATTAGSQVSLGVVGVGRPAPTYQWRKDGNVLSGSSAPGLHFLPVETSDAGTYEVVLTNSAGTATSAPIQLTVAAVDSAVHEPAGGTGYHPGGTVTISNTLRFTGTPASVGWTVTIPAGWTLASSSDQAGTRPGAGASGTLSWTWTNTPPSPVTFTYTLNVPAAASGPASISASGGALPIGGTAARDFTLVRTHSADTNRDFRIGLVELTRVIELYNTRSGTIRTGNYTTAAGSEDGFGPDAARAAAANIALARYHSADTDRDGALGLIELTRVIELYNSRSGSVRTGAFRAEPATEDGFAAGP